MYLHMQGIHTLKNSKSGEGKILNLTYVSNAPLHDIIYRV